MLPAGCNAAKNMSCTRIYNGVMRLLVFGGATSTHKKKVEIKKTEKASLEPRRPVWFLLSMVVALSTLYVALEWNTSAGGTGSDSSQFDDMQDLDLMPAMDRSDMIAAAPSGAPSKPAAKNVKVVDEVRKEIERNAAISDMRSAQADGDGGANGQKAQDDEETTKALPPVAVDKDDNPLKLRVVEQLPEFPGGMVELMKWITRNLHYPYAAQQQKIQGRVMVTFIINRDGTIANIKIVKSVHPLLDNEARRIVRMMPNWKPGIENGKPCRTMFAIPIEFKL